jgi:alpha-glucosidase
MSVIRRRWWEEAVFYQIYPRSFCDASGDGVGDLEGIRQKLGYLQWLGVDGVWICPFYPSPMADFGYDVADYCDVDPLFGTLADFDALVGDAHKRGIKLLVDWVPNHTSDQHPWFVESRSSRDSPRRDWYWWRDDRSDADGGHGPAGSPGRLPNNWRAAFTGIGRSEFPPAWSYDKATRQWYLHLFLESQPDLNWHNPQVRSAMEDTLRFWLARGVDGFRVDVAHGLGKDPALPDLPAAMAEIPASAQNDDPSTHPILASLRQLIDSWPEPPERMMVGEVYLLDTAKVAPYYGSPDQPELHLAFNFVPLWTPWSARAWKSRVDEIEEAMAARSAWPTWALSNHDHPRQRTRYGSEARARAAAVLLLGLRGTPFLYAGEELGLEDAKVGPGEQVDPGGRDGCRAPFPWDASPGHGWAGGAQAWLPWPPGADGSQNVKAQKNDPASILNLYRSLIALRRASPALRSGTFEWLDCPEGTLCWRREEPMPGGDCRLVMVNFTEGRVSAPLPQGEWVLELSSLVPGGRPGARSGRIDLDADEAAVLRRSPGG